MKTYFLPSGPSEFVRILHAEHPDQFQQLEQAAATLEPITEIAHFTFFEGFCLMNVTPDKEVDVYEMLQAGAFLGEWLKAHKKEEQ